MHIARYQPSHQPVWDAYVNAAKNGHFMHRRGYMEYHADRFSDHSLLFLGEDGKPVALLPANEAAGIFYSHQGLTFGGLILSSDARAAEVLQIMDALVAYAREQKFTQLIYKAIPTLYHQAPAREDEYALFRHNAELFRVDITTTIDMAHPISFSSLRKRGAKKAEKAGVIVQKSTDFAAFHGIIRSILQEKYDTQVTHSQAEMELLAARFPENITLHAASLDAQMLAGVLVFATATVAHAQYIGASEQGRDVGALDLLFSQLIQTEYKHKRYFDFGISTEQAGRHLNTNLIAQKEGFGGRGNVHSFFRITL